LENYLSGQSDELKPPKTKSSSNPIENDSEGEFSASSFAHKGKEDREKEEKRAMREVKENLWYLMARYLKNINVEAAPVAETVDELNLVLPLIFIADSTMLSLTAYHSLTSC